MLDDRRSDPHWQLERRIAELLSERKLLQYEIQHRYTQISSLNAEVELLRKALLEVGEPS